MTARTITVEVRTPTQVLHQMQDVKWARLKLVNGYWASFYPGHARLMAQTLPGSLHYADENGEYDIDAPPGILTVARDRVTLLTMGDTPPVDTGDTPPAVMLWAVYQQGETDA